MKHKYSILFALFFLVQAFCLYSPVYANGANEKIQISLKDLKSHKIIPIKNGVLVTHIKNTKPVKGMKEIIVDSYDQNLVKLKSIKFQINKKYNFICYTKEADFVYFLYAKPLAERNIPIHHESDLVQVSKVNECFMDYTIVKFSPNSAEVQTYSGVYHRKFSGSTFEVKKGVVYLGGAAGRTFWGNAKVYIILAPVMWVPIIFYKQTYKPCVLSIDMNEQQPLLKEKYFKEYGKGFTRISGLDINESEEEFNMFITSVRKRETTLSCRTVQGDEIGKEEKIRFPKEKVLSYVKVKNVGDTKVYAGVYRSKESNLKGAKNEGKISEGLVVGMSNNSKNVFNTVISYNKLQNASFMFNEHHDQREVKKKDNADVVASVLFHDILVKDDKVIFMGEMYYSHTHIEMVTRADGRGGVNTYPAPVFDGYKRKGILVFAVDLKGKLLWDNAIEIIDGTNSEELNEKIIFSEQADSAIYVSYGDGETVKTALFDGAEKPVVINETVFTSVKVNKKEGKKVKQKFLAPPEVEEFHESTLEYWYDDYFIEYGESVNKSNPQIKAKSFYINKIDVS